MIAAVDALSIYNPTSAPAYDLDAFLGDWQMLNAPEFKGDLGLNLRPRAADRLATRAKLAECNEKAPDESAVKIYEREAPTTPPDNIVVFSANADDGATRCVLRGRADSGARAT